MIAAVLLLATALQGAPACDQLFVSANDGAQILRDGAQVVPERPVPGSVSVVALEGNRLRIVAEVAAPASIIGPPRSVAVTPDCDHAVVTSARRVAVGGHAIEPDDRVTLIALGPTPRVVQTVRAGAGASGVAIAADGRRVLVANRSAGTLSLFVLEEGRLRAVATIAVGAPDASPAQPLFFAHDTRAMVTRDGDSRVAVVAVEGDRLRLLPRALAAGVRPYGIDAAGRRHVAAVAAIGGGGTDADTVSLVALDRDDPRVLDTVSVGATPEGIAVSPDERYVAVNLNNGSNLPSASPHHRAQGRLQVWRIANDRLSRVTDIPVGAWGQGVAWSRDGRTLLVQDAVEHRLASFRFDGRRLARGPTLSMPSEPAALAAANR